MKRILNVLLSVVLVLTLCIPLKAYADGGGNIDHGGGGLGGGTGESFWDAGDEGVRVTVIRASDHAIASASVDFTNKHPNNIEAHFGKVSKMAYTNGRSLIPSAQSYTYYNPNVNKLRCKNKTCTKQFNKFVQYTT
jgi:hypothetical protein